MGKIWSANQDRDRILYTTTDLEITAVTNSTSEGLIAPRVNIPARYMEKGRVLRASLVGQQSNVVTTPGTITLRVRWTTVGPNAAGNSGTIITASPALTQSTTALITTWTLDYVLTSHLDLSTTGEIIGVGKFFRTNQASGAANVTIIPADDSSGYLTAGGTVDTTTEAWLSFTVQFSVPTDLTMMTTYSFVLESLN